LRKRGCLVSIDRSDKERGSTYQAQSDETVYVEQTGSHPPTVFASPKSKNSRRTENPEAQQAA
jgi:hypothetical protein